MTLSLNGNSNGFMKGVFINEATVLSVADLSGKPTYQDDEDSIRDLAIEIEFDIGYDWAKKVIFKGNFKCENSKVIGWHSAFVVRDFFIKTGCFEGLTKEEVQDRLHLLESKELPVDFMIKPRGKKLFILDYVKGISEEGKPRYSTWNIVHTDEEKLKESFQASLKKGYPQNYKPELLDSPEKVTSFEFGANVSEDGDDEEFVI